MKKFLLLSTFIVVKLFSYAQPSSATMMAKIKSREPNAKILWNGAASSERILEDGVWNYYYRRSYLAKRKTKYAGITKVYSGGIQYKKVGGKYVFDQMLVGQVFYKGVPEPNKAEIIKFLKSDMGKYLGANNLHDIVGDVSEITFPPNPEWYWQKLTDVEFITKVTYSSKVSYTEIEKAEYYYKVTLISDEYKGPWKRFLSYRMPNKKKVISKTKYSSKEISEMETYESKIQTKGASSYFDALPQVGEIPKFETDKQLFYYVHNIIFTKSPKEVEAYLYKLQSKGCFYEQSNILRTQRAEKWVNNIRDHIDILKKMYCEYPVVKHYQPGSITFFDKQNKHQLEYQGSYENGTWKLFNINFYPSSKSEANTIANMNTNCQEKPDLTVRKIVQYKKGDKVNAKFKNGTFPYVIDKRDGNNDRYYIRAEGNPNGRGYWMNEKFLSPRTSDTTQTNNQEETKKVNTNTTTESFKLGDKVQMQTRSKGWLNAEIIKVLGNKFLIKFEGNYKDMWVSASNIRKRN